MLHFNNNNDKVDKSGDGNTQTTVYIWETKLMKKKIVKVCPFVVLFFAFISFTAGNT